MPLSDIHELLIQVSEDDDEIFGSIPRYLVHGNPSLIHRAVHVLILNEQGHLLLQCRSAIKDTHPGKWDTSVGGHVGYGQTYLAAAHREAEEELGITLNSFEFLYFSKFRNEMESENIHTFFSQHSGPFIPNADEIDRLKFWSRTEIELSIGAGIFTPNFEVEYAAFKASFRGKALC